VKRLVKADSYSSTVEMTAQARFRDAAPFNRSSNQP
jgi:hypothetical protein